MICSLGCTRNYTNYTNCTFQRWVWVYHSFPITPILIFLNSHPVSSILIVFIVSIILLQQLLPSFQNCLDDNVTTIPSLFDEEAYRALDAQLDRLNSVLDALEERNDRIHSQMKDMLKTKKDDKVSKTFFSLPLSFTWFFLREINFLFTFPGAKSGFRPTRSWQRRIIIRDGSLNF